MNDFFLLELEKKGKPNFDDWRDYGIEILKLYDFLKTYGEVVQVLGLEGSGKTVGAYYLEPSTTLMINCDRKSLTFPNAEINYPENGKNHKIPPKGLQGYAYVKQLVQAAYEKRDPRMKKLVIICTGHTEMYKDNGIERQRLKVVGKLATKLNIEGSVIHSYYTEVSPNPGLQEHERYQLITRNTGFNTGRSPMGMWAKDRIPNNYNMILYKILKSWGVDLNYQNKATDITGKVIDDLDYDSF